MNYSNLMDLKNIYLDNINEPNDNHLSLTFDRSKKSTVPESINIGGHVINNVYSLDIDYTLPMLQIDFESYIGYSILDESYADKAPYEEFKGSAFRIYSKSGYLDFIKSNTFATKDYPGPFKHYSIVCLNHIIDIVSVSEPIIKEINRNEI